MSTTAEVKDYISTKCWTIKRTEKWATGPQLILDCPLCGKQTDAEHRRFYLNEHTGQWRTWCCNEQGNLLTLKRRLGDMRIRIMSAAGAVDERARALGQRILQTRGKGKPALSIVKPEHKLPEVGLDEQYHTALMGHEGAKAWLQAARGFTDETLASTKLGYRHDKLGRDWISVPQYLPDGQLAGFKYRVCPWDQDKVKERFAREPNCPTVLYGAERLGNAPSVAIYEAELDARSGDQMGLPLGLSSTAGAGTWLPEWTTLLAGVDTIYLCHDADKDGDEGAEKVADALGRWRCRRVQLPAHDMNECLAADLKDEVLTAFAIAEPMPHPLVVQAGDLKAGLVKLDGKARGASWGIPAMDALLCGRRGGEITIVSGETGHGKTTWTSFLAWVAATAGDPALIGSFEHPALDEGLKLVTMEAGKTFLDLPDADKVAAVNALHAKPIYLIDAYGMLDTEVIFDTLRYFYKACGGKLAVLDHLQFIIESNERAAASGRTNRRHESIDAFLVELERLLKEELTGLHVLLVAHPKEAQKDGRKRSRITKDDIKGSSGIKQVADNIIIVRKVLRLDGKRRAYIDIDKARFLLAQEGELIFEFVQESLHYIDIPPAAPPATTTATTPSPAPASQAPPAAASTATTTATTATPAPSAPASSSITTAKGAARAAAKKKTPPKIDNKSRAAGERDDDD